MLLQAKRGKRSRDGWQKMRVMENIIVKQNDILKPITREKKLVWWIARERGMNLSFMQINLGKHIFGERLLNMRQFCCFLYVWDSVTGFWKMMNPKRHLSRRTYPLSREQQRPCWYLIPVNK